ncbi:MAG: hypothetical protein ACOY40_02060 [Bacillota bacterium]
MIKMPDFNLEDFFTAYLQRAGALVEKAGFALREVLLPDELAPSFKDSHLMLAFDHEVASETPGSVYVTYGSQLLDTSVRLALGYGRYTDLYWPGDPPSTQKQIDRQVNESIEFVHCRSAKQVVQWALEHVFYAFVFRCTFRSFEKTEDTVTVVVDGYTGCVHPEFEEMWKNVVSVESPAYKLPSAEVRPLADLYRTACREAENMALRQAAALRRSARSALRRELARIAGYYEETVREIEKRMAAAEGEKKDRFGKQIEAARADWKRREKDAAQRYQLEAELRLDHLMACHLPCLHAKMEVQHRDRFLHQVVVYNPLYARVEAPVCPRCSRPTRRLVPGGNGVFICPDHKD